MVKATTKRERKYGKKESEIMTPDDTPKAPKKFKGTQRKCKVLIDRSNFHSEVFKSRQAAEKWIERNSIEQHGTCSYSIVEV